MQSKEVIVCDDEAELRESLIEYLESRGYTARGASNGEVLAHMLATRSPDLVVLDNLERFGPELGRVVDQVILSEPLHLVGGRARRERLRG